MRGTRIICLFLISFLAFSQWGAISYGDDASHTGPAFLLDKYQEIEKNLEKNSGPVPFYIESSANKNASHVDIYGVVKYPFKMVQNEFLVPTNWCNIVLPHLNVGACTYKKVNDTWLLNIYHVDNLSEPLEDAYKMKFVYRVSKLQPAYFDVALTAGEGPSHTKDHRFELEATPLKNNITFIHLHYSLGYSALGYFLMKIFGGDKIGFSIIGTDKNGNPVYASGLRGSAERTVVGYYFAIIAYLDTVNIPAEQRYKKQINRWYDLASRYKKQLIETDKGKYFTSKIQDRKSQLILQNDLNR